MGEFVVVAADCGGDRAGGVAEYALLAVRCGGDVLVRYWQTYK